MTLPVIAADTYLFLGSKVIDDVEKLPDFLRGLALDHVCNGFAPNIPGTELDRRSNKRV